jgi:hypothetical protein
LGRGEGEEIKGRRKLENKKLHNVYPSPDIITVVI